MTGAFIGFGVFCGLVLAVDLLRRMLGYQDCDR